MRTSCFFFFSAKKNKIIETRQRQKKQNEKTGGKSEFNLKGKRVH